jgi:hypothetical protein
MLRPDTTGDPDLSDHTLQAIRAVMLHSEIARQAGNPGWNFHLG